MTSRPNVGGSRALQRSSSTTSAAQNRPAPNRTLSHQFSSSSPTRQGFVDLAFDGDGALSRHAPRLGTSRLRVEISKDSRASETVESPKLASGTTPTWRPSFPPRGRPQLHFDVPSVSNLSPRPAQEGGHNEVSIKPMPLPIRPRHALPSSRKIRSVPNNTAKKDARPKPYVLEVPVAAPHYPPNGTLISQQAQNNTHSNRSCRLLPMDRQSPRGPILRASYPSGLF